MKKYIYIIIALLGLVSCKNEIEIGSLPEDCSPIVLKGIRAVIDNGTSTRAVAPLVDSIGKYKFLPTDEIIFTKIQRTKHPIEGFSYKNVRYSSTADTASWTRENPEEDIFWSDGSEPHTFIGYILPHLDAQKASALDYDWNYLEEKGRYYGSIGNPTKNTEDDAFIDYTSTSLGDPNYTKAYDLEKLRKEDLLLTYDTEMQNEDAFAVVHFHHALASVRVVVTISGFSTTGKDPDAETKVKDMLLHDQPTMYKWDGKSYKADPLEEEDQSVLNGINWGDNVTAPKWNQKKNMKLWQSREYRGSGASRTFTFYGIVTPGFQDEVKMDFQVNYPDPLDPNQTNPHRLEKTYTATLKLSNDKKVEFRPGYCTNITINLNHKDEKMTVGAEYMSWQFEDTPDEGSLKKNSTFLENAPAFVKGKDKNIVTIIGDTKAENPDDATWLYVAGKDANNKDIIKDIYGHDGNSPTSPYTISTAEQLLSFAYEVKNGQDFVHKYVKLEADITMQKDKDSKTVNWIGIGDKDNPFNGFFLGSNRYINRLQGQHFFHTVGLNAVIDKLNFENVIEVQGCGVVAHKNLGLICGCYIDGDVNETNDETQYTGSIVGENHSFIIACAHVGKVIGKSSIIGGLVGFNNGTIMACYHAGEVKAAAGSTSEVHATVGKRGDETGGTNNSIMFSCYYNNDSITHTPNLQPGKSGYPLSTTTMQSNAFVNAEAIVFDYDGSNYTTVVKRLRDAVLEILGDGFSDKTDQQLITELLKDGVTSANVQKLFEYHFSLNEALHVFKVWLDAIAAEANTKDNDYYIDTNCHQFTKAQILFLQQHYTAEHKYIYTPATYPKVQ